MVGRSMNMCICMHSCIYGSMWYVYIKWGWSKNFKSIFTYSHAQERKLQESLLLNISMMLKSMKRMELIQRQYTDLASHESQQLIHILKPFCRPSHPELDQLVVQLQWPKTWKYYTKQNITKVKQNQPKNNLDLFISKQIISIQEYLI